ncbi:S-adenosyl-L-methionine-dependent methyltransferase [Umbelopsis sp. PMI_123]|nr:S-adenosyl-L-methionine-dependent methyltransferase [Umbelopsis sp. PMI_123]
MPNTDKETHRKITETQTRHRIKLVKEWEISDSSSVLEIGCGQGDTTIVLADAVGAKGKVTAIDIAEEDYGSPLTVGQSMQYLKDSDLGNRIDYHFNTDITSSEADIHSDYDVAILSHCSFYFNNPEDLVNIFSSLRKKAKKLCFAEHLAYFPDSKQQLPHFLALSIHAQIQARVGSTRANIRTLFTPEMIREASEKAGWNINREFQVETPELQDAGWEVSDLLHTKIQDLEDAAKGDKKWLELIRAHLQILKDARKRVNHCDTLPTWGFVAE